MSTTTVEAQELSARWAELIALARAGTEIIVTEGGAPSARLAPLAEGQARVPNLHPDAFVMADDFDAALPDEFWLGES